MSLNLQNYRRFELIKVENGFLIIIYNDKATLQEASLKGFTSGSSPFLPILTEITKKINQVDDEDWKRSDEEEDSSFNSTFESLKQQLKSQTKDVELHIFTTKEKALAFLNAQLVE